ncbi:hypothetical protein H0H92_014472 [Tricholoma furcatifolium]|nr:hypothetical protein H0H92_014472 [Tricholoma furcatifolium]
MSSDECQTTAGVVSEGHHKTHQVKKSARIHPPRLQHSPSLPNIWFPPHSGPIQIEGVSREPPRRLSTPPFPDVDLVSSTSTEKNMCHRESLSLDLVEHLQQTRPLKIQMRRRVDRDHGHSLLTPPLTPSSSLKTATSSDSAIDRDHETTQKSQVDETDRKSSRFLLLGNVSKPVPHDMLRDSIVNALTSPGVAASENKLTPLADDSIKGVFLRCQRTDGIAMLAFFDIRHAEIAKDIISAPTMGPLSLCVGDELTSEGLKSWITCQFISAEELAKVIGSSPFLTSTDASFYLSAEGKSGTSRDNTKEFTDQAVVATANDATVDINISMLKKFLESFGGIRFFSLVKGADNKKQGEAIFHIEYYDVREANAAYAAVNDHVMFGMKLRVFGRENISETTSPEQRTREPAEAPVVVHPHVSNKSCVESTPSTEHHGEPSARFGYPGQFSRTRERFAINQIPHSPTPSPTYFYTSAPISNIPPMNSPNDYMNRSAAEDPSHSPDGCQWLWDGAAHPQPTPEFYPHHDCYYCPSRGSPATSPATCYAPCSTPSPYCYQQERSTPQNPTFAASCHPVVGYHHGAPYPQALTPALPLNAPRLLPEPFMAAALPQGDMWFPDSTNAMQNILYCGPPTIPGYPSATSYEVPVLPELATDVHHPNLTSTSGPPFAPTCASELTLSHVNSSLAKEPRPSAEHNQLNISRIEDGQDTRTTVMIKNIPNKMSDKDLIAFIGNVCPRRIDFLYLRMDFQNGCNVGYAFVNFITVQDLLVFAKKKLGEKWWMSILLQSGKEALVEKFKNSCIMDEQEAWRPKIFYSEPGPEQGLPEPFPAPTHIRRKERSAVNRGALYVPGAGRSFVPQPMVQTRRLEDTRRGDRQGQTSYTRHRPASSKPWGTVQE